MAITFEAILKQMKAEQAKLLEEKTMDWYLKQIRDVASQKLSQNVPKKQPVSEERAQEAREKMKGNAIYTQSSISKDLAGKMIFYRYDPKWKKELPYYDIFPLVFPIWPIETNKSWLGLNMHYLPPYERARFMTGLYTLINTTNKLDARTNLRLRYEYLKQSSKFMYFKPCLKRYLTSHIRSQIITIDPNQWNYVLLLPTAQFIKASTFKVWNDSVRMIYKR